MRKNSDDQSYSTDSWDEDAEYIDAYDDEYGEYDDYDAYDDEYDYDLDDELGSEHKFRIAMNVFDLISMLVGLAVILVLAALLFSLFNWVQRDIAQSLSVITAPFR